MKWGLLIAILVVAAVSGPTFAVEDNLNVEYVTFGDNCNDDTSLCEVKSFLVCSPLGQCECPVDMAFSEVTHKCEKVESAPSNQTSTDLLDNWPEENLSTWELTEEDSKHDVVADKVKQEESGIKIQPRPNVSVSVHGNSEESQENYDSGEENDWHLSSEESPESPEVIVQPRARTNVIVEGKANQLPEMPSLEAKETGAKQLGEDNSSSIESHEVTENSQENGSNVKPLLVEHVPEIKVEPRLNVEDEAKGQHVQVVQTSDYDHDFWSDSSEEEDEWTIYDDNKGVDKVPEPQPPLPASSDFCLNDDNCLPYFSCNAGKCECSGLNKILIEDKCYPLKTINSPCISEMECDAVIEGPAWCHEDLETFKSTCQCQVFSYWEAELSACLPYASKGLESECQRDEQCSADEALGSHARCSEVTGRCECSNVLASETRTIRFFEDRCIVERDLNETCRTAQDCEASLGIHAICKADNTCACKEGHSCDRIQIKIGGFSIEAPRMSTLSVIILASVATVFLVGGILFFAIRRRDNYTFITNAA